jgi:hypothetical protein
MKLIYRIYNNLPRNNKAVEVYENLRTLVGVYYSSADECDIVDYVRYLVQRANESHPRTTPYSVRTSKDIVTGSVDGIVVALDSSDKCLQLVIAEGRREWKCVRFR